MDAVKNLSAKANIVIGRDVKVNDESVYSEVITNGSLGLGESYMKGKWDAEHLDDIFYKIGRANLTSRDISWSDKLNLAYQWVLGFIWNPQSVEKSKDVATKHYNLSNEFYSKMLDSRMIYSCAYWKEPSFEDNLNEEILTDIPLDDTESEQLNIKEMTLDEAQTAKCELICKKLKLKPGMYVLDIGCGFGGLSYYMAEHYQVKVLAITNSEQQYKYAPRCNNIEYRLCDYRNLKTYDKKFDAIVSVGMFEHVGPSNYRELFEIVSNLLTQDGIFLLHTIGGNKSRSVGDRWFNKYIFPNSVLPSLSQIVDSSQDIFIIEDVHNFGTYYDKTLMSWYYNFDKSYLSKHGLELTVSNDTNSQFYRMWKYYLLSSAGLFRSRNIQLYQVVFTKHKIGGYESVR